MDTDRIEETPETFVDRSQRLVLLGSLLVILGASSAVLGIMSGAVLYLFEGMDTMGDDAMPVSSIAEAVALYLALGVWFMVLGIGSIQCRRWARDLTLVASAVTVAYSTMGAIVLVLYVPFFDVTFLEESGFPAELFLMTMIFMAGFAVFFCFLVPVLYFALYRREDVFQTCAYYNPKPSWTEGVPKPLLALLIFSVFFGGSAAIGAISGSPVPFFGAIVDGPAAALLRVVFSAALIAAAWKACALRPAAWWVYAGLVVGAFATFGITLARVGLMEFYEMMFVMDDESQEMLEAMNLDSPAITWVTAGNGVLWAAVLLGFLLYLRRYFQPEAHVSA